MISKALRHASLLCAPALAGLLLAAAPAKAQTAPAQPAPAQPAIDADATKILSQMQAYLSGLKKFTVSYDADFDVLSPEGEKLKFLSYGDIAVSRPGHLRVTRKGAIADVTFVLDGSQASLFGAGVNAYVQAPATSIDEAVEVLRDKFGFPVPGADLFVSKPLDLSVTDVVSGVHVGMAMLGGEKVHHLAFRGAKADWQIWIKDGDQPLPVRYVITSKWTAGAPEYSLRLSDWNVEPADDPALFTFTPPAGAQKISQVVVDEAGDIIGIGE